MPPSGNAVSSMTQVQVIVSPSTSRSRGVIFARRKKAKPSQFLRKRDSTAAG
jgi:hypothetical protein